MKVTIEIKDEKQLELIEQLRGKHTAKDYVRMCYDVGLKLAEFQRKQYKEADEKGMLLKFAAAKPEFKTLDVAAITAALKDKDPQNPVRIEVGRLVQDYASQLKKHAEKNGNKLPANLKVSPQAPIEKVAFQITSEAIKNAVKTSNQKTAASAK